MAVVLILRLVPPIFAAPVGGVLADRLDRRTIMVSCDVIAGRADHPGAVRRTSACCTPSPSSTNASRCSILPARDASIPRLVRRENLEEANGLILASSYGTLPLAAAVFSALAVAAGHIPSAVPMAGYFGHHPTSFAFFFDAASFVFSALMIAGLPIAHKERPEHIAFLSDIREGFRYVVVAPGPAIHGLRPGGVDVRRRGAVRHRHRVHPRDARRVGRAIRLARRAVGRGHGRGPGAWCGTLVRRGERQVFVVAVAACGGVLIMMALLPYLWLSFVLAVVFGASFSVAIVIALTLVQRVTEDAVRGRIMGGVQMLFRLGLGAGALGIGALARAFPTVTLGPVTLDGNQIGLIAGGTLILLGAAASLGAVRAPAWEQK